VGSEGFSRFPSPQSLVGSDRFVPMSIIPTGTDLEMIEVFATVFLVFRIYLIFQNVNEPTYFRFFWIVRLQNNRSFKPCL